MTFSQGQQVRIKGKPFVGIVQKKLISLDNVYIVALGNQARDEEKMIRGEDLEIIPELDPQGRRGSQDPWIPS